MESTVEIPSRRTVIDAQRAAGMQIAAVLPIHYPRALLRSFGYHPMEVWGPPGVDPGLGNRHFQAYSCAIVRHATAFLLGDAAEQVDLIMVPHTCDALQGMGSVFKDFIKPRQPVVTLYHPRARRDCDRQFLLDELRELARSLEAHSGQPLDLPRLSSCIADERRADDALRELALNRRDVALSDREFYTLLRSREYLPPETFADLAQGAPKAEQPTPGGVPLLISGIVPEPMALFDELNTMGAHVVADDLACCSRRLYQSEPTEDPFDALAQMMLSMSPDPTVGTPIRDRVRFLAATMERSGARGMLIYDVKFCEPELFDLPIIRQELSKLGLPVLHVEYEMGPGALSQQSLTRIEAFVETLS